MKPPPRYFEMIMWVTINHTPYTEDFQGNSERAWCFSAFLFCNRKLFEVWFGVEFFCVIKDHSFLLEKKCLCDYLLNFNEMKIGSRKFVTYPLTSAGCQKRFQRPLIRHSFSFVSDNVISTILFASWVSLIWSTRAFFPGEHDCGNMLILSHN